MPKKHSLVSLERRSNSPQTPLKNHPPFHILLTLKTQFRDPDHNSTHHHVIATPPKHQKGSVIKASTPDHRPNTRSTSKKTTDRLTKSVTKSPIGRQTRASIANSNSKHRTSPTQTRKPGTATGSQRFYNTVVTRNTRSRVGHTTPKRGAQTKKPTSTHKDKRSAEKGNNVGKIASPRARRNANNIPQYTGYNTRSSAIYVKREEMEVEPTVQTRSRYNIETKLKKEYMSPRIVNKPKSPRHRKATPVVVSSDSEVEKGSYWTSPVSRHRSRTNAARTSPKRAQRVTPSHKGRGMTERVAKATKRRRPIETINLEEDEDENDFAKETRTPAKKGAKSRAEIKSQRKAENKIQRAKESLPKFPKKEEDIESLIVEAVNALKNQDLEKRIMDYFDKKFAGVNKRSVKNVIEHIEFDAKLIAQSEVQSRGGVKVEENRSTITTKQEEPFNRTLFPEHSTRKSLNRMSTRLRDERLKIEEPQIQSTKVEENEEQVKRVRFKDVQVVEDESEDDVIITRTRSRNKAEHEKRRPSFTENKVINTPEIPAKRKRGRPPKKGKESITKTEVKISASKSPAKMNIIPAKASISRSAGKASISREPEEAEEKPKRKRGRPRKQQGPYYELTEKAMSSVSITVEEEKKPKRRGRPPKQKKEEQVEVQENVVTGKKSLEKQQVEDVEEEAIEEEMEVEVETEVEVERTKRGRKSKSPMEKTSTMSTETSGKYLEEKELSQLKSARTQAKGSQSKASVSKKSFEGTSERPIEVPDLPSERKQMSNRTVRKTPAKPSDFVLEPKKQSTRSARRSSRSKKEDPIEIIDDDHEEKIQRVFENPLKSIIADLSLEIDRESDQKKSEEVDSPELTIHDFQLPKEDFKTTMGKMILPGLREEAGIMERKRGNLLTESEKLKDKLRENIAKFFEEEKVRLTKEGKIRLYGSDKFGAWEKALKRNVDALEGGENRETIMSTKEIEIDKESDQSDSIVEIEEISFEETKRNRGELDLEIEYNKELGIEQKQQKKLVKRMAVETEDEKVRESEFLKTPSSYKTQSKGSGSARDPLFKTPENLSFQDEGFSRPKPLDLPSANMDIDKLSLISPGRTLGGNESVPFLSAIQSALRDPNGSEARHRIDYEGVFVQKFNVFGNNGDDKDKINDPERRDLETSDIQEPKPIKKRKLNEEKSPQGSEQKEGESEGHHEKMVVEEEPLSESVPEAKNTDQNESHELE